MRSHSISYTTFTQNVCKKSFAIVLIAFIPLSPSSIAATGQSLEVVQTRPQKPIFFGKRLDGPRLSGGCAAHIGTPYRARPFGRHVCGNGQLL